MRVRKVRHGSRGNPMRVAAAWLLAIGFSQMLAGQQGTASPSPPLTQSCTMGQVERLEKAPSPQFQAKIDALRHRDIYACAGSGLLQWAEIISFPEVKTAAKCDDAKHKYPRPEFPPLQPLRIEDAGYSSDPFPRVVLLFRLASGKQVKETLPVEDQAWESEDPLAIFAYSSGFYLDPYNSPFTAAEVHSIQQKDFPVGTRREVLDCAKGWDRED